MEMRAVEDIAIGQCLTPPIPPIAVALHDSHLFTHCSACFSPLHSAPTVSTNSHHVPAPFLRYCSTRCSSLDSPLHFSSAEFHFLRHLPASVCPDTSDLRLSLRLLHRFETLRLVSENDDALDRIGGLMTNRAKLLRMQSREDMETGDDDEVYERIKEGARAMAAARRMRCGLDLESSLARDCWVEESVLSLVLTNAVDVQDSAGCSIGVAVYGPSFSWINHSCSPNSSYRFSWINHSCSSNSSYRFLTMPCSNAASSWLIYPVFSDYGNGNGSELINNSLSLKLGCDEAYGPRLIVRSINEIKKGEELLITYTDLLQPKGMRRSELWFKYRFHCCCNRCNAVPEAYVDHVLEEVSLTNLEDCPTSTATNKEKLVEFFDEAIDDFLTFNNSISCCSKLENLLTYGYANEHLKPEETHGRLKLHPFHHLSLNAYTTLASAYKALASELSAMDQFKAFSFSKAGAAYSLLLAGSTHHLSFFEPSLIVSAANFWTSAGESLLGLIRSPLWDSGSKLAPFSTQSCDKCTLIHNRFAGELPEITMQFLNCISSLTPRVWRFLAEEGPFLSSVKDPVDFTWIGSMEFTVLAADHVVELKSKSGSEGVDSNYCESLFQIGLHCSSYGSFLSKV